MSAAERKRARKAMQEALGEIDQQWTRHLAGPAVGWDKLREYVDSKAPLLDLVRWSINEGPAAMAQTWQWVRGLPGPGAIPRLVREQLEKLPGPLGEMMPEAFDAVVGEAGERTGWRMPGKYVTGTPGGPSGALERILGAQTVGEVMDYVAAETQGLLRHLPGDAFSEDSATLALLAAAGIVVVTGGAALAVFGPGAVLAAAGVGFVTGAASGAVGQLVQDLSTGTWSGLEEYLGPGGWGRLQEDLATVEWSSRETYGKQMLLGGIGGAVAGVVGMGASALGLSPLVGGALSGLSVGAVQQFAANLVEGQSWHAGVMQSALVGGISGAVAGGVVGAVNPQSLPARVALGALVGGGVSGGTQVAFNVMGGRPWNEGLGQAVTIGATTGAVDAFTDYYGDKVMDRVMTPRPRARTVDTDADGLRLRGADDGSDMLFRPRSAGGELGGSTPEAASLGLGRLLAPDTGGGGGVPRRVGDGPEGVKPKKRVLVVGESNTLEYSQKLHQLHPDWEIVATTYGDVDAATFRELDVPVSERMNKVDLRKGVEISVNEQGGMLKVITDVDATRLHQDPRMRGQRFDDIVFTNPRGPDNMLIEGARVSWQTSTADLVQGVLHSASQGGVLRPGGVVHFSATTTETSPAGLPLRNLTKTGTHVDPITRTRYDIGLGDVYDPVLGPRGGRSGVRYWSPAGQEFSVEYTPRQSSGQPFDQPGRALEYTNWFRFTLR